MSRYPSEVWRASDYVASTAEGVEQGACVMVGDDIIVNLPFPPIGSWSESVQRNRARRIAACMNACDGIATDALEMASRVDVVPMSREEVARMRAKRQAMLDDIEAAKDPEWAAENVSEETARETLREWDEAHPAFAESPAGWTP